LLALWLGGWVAGRAARARTAELGGLHGLVVWSAVTSVDISLHFRDNRWTVRTSGEDGPIERSPKPARREVRRPSALENPLQQFVRNHPDPLSSFVDEALAASPSLSALDAVRARREIGWALYRLFSQGQVPLPENRLLASKRSRK